MISLQWRDLVIAIIKIILMLFIIDLAQSTFLVTTTTATIFVVPIHLLMVIYFSFRTPVSYLPMLVTLIAVIHSLFTLEGPGLEMMSLLIVSFSIVSIKDLVQINLAFLWMIFTYLIQLYWALWSGLFLSVKLGDWGYVGQYLTFQAWEGLISALLAPFVYKLFQIVLTSRSSLFLSSSQGAVD